MRTSNLRTSGAIAALALLSACGGGGSSAPDKPVIVLVDTDKDGTPDENDVAPSDPLCAAASDASGGVCYLKILAASRLKIVGNANGKVFFSSEDDALRLYAYDMNTRHFLGRTSMSGFTPTAFAYVPEHNRLYVGDSNGNIHAYSESMQEDARIFAKLPLQVRGLTSAGKFLLAQDESGAWASHYVFDRQGTQLQNKEWNYYSRHYEWSAGLSRLYFFRDDTSPNDLMFETIDQATGTITGQGETPYHGSYTIKGPIRVSQSGAKVLLGSGDIYTAPDLTWSANIGKTFTDAAWMANDELLLFAPNGSNTRLTRLGANRQLLEELEVNGELLGFGQAGNAKYVIVKQAANVAFVPYVPSDDSDGDGVPNLQDRFPQDKTAAVDSDGDGYPDAFLGNYTAADSPTGLKRDYYPNDAACYAQEQGDGKKCNYASVINAYMPDQVMTDSQGTIYLLSKAANRVYRWSPEKREYISPLVIGQAAAYGASAPLLMTYSASHNRLYFGYSNGDISYINLLGDHRETTFSTLATSVGGLAAAGNFIVAQDGSGAWSSHYVLDKQGTTVQVKDWNYRSGSYDWNSSQSRLYFFRDDTSPNDLMYEELDQASGKITASGDSPYHGDYPIAGPIRVSLGGGRIATGAGIIYSASDLTVVKKLGLSFVDIQWREDGTLVALVRDGMNARVLTFSSALEQVKEQAVAGLPKALVRSGGLVYAVTQSNSYPAFTLINP